MGIILCLVFLGYLILAAVVIGITAKCAKSKKTVWLVVMFFVLFPFRRLIFYQTLFSFYSRTPLQEIHETVESPISVYWEDNVWPGFDEYGRHWMVKNYLDGKHLKALALNGEDGMIYLYRATEDDFAGSTPLIEEMKKLVEKQAVLKTEFTKIYKKEFLSVHKIIRFPADNEIRRKYIDTHPLHQQIEKLKQQIGTLKTRLHEIRKQGEQRIFARKERYPDKKYLPPMQYTVRFDSLSLSWPFRDWLHADRISIIDNKTGREIGYSRRYMAYSSIITRISDEMPKFDYTLGDIQVYEFDDKVLFEYAGVSSSYESKRSRLDK